jgi:glycosyltransferase involved in cell wall biosynthesis
MDNPVISIIVLSWNRELLLRNTILSLLVTTKSKFEIFIVDNASTDGSKEWLQVFSNFYPSIKVFFLDENIGGEAFNIPLSKVKGKYVLFSENDLEYLPGWDEYMIHQFESFSELGQLSPFAPNPMREIGEVWVDKPFEVEKKGNEVLFKAIHNVTTTCMVRTELLEKGLKWTNLISKEGLFKFPADGKFSADVKNMGYLVGWSDQYKSINWGFNQRIISKEKEYYNENWKEKSNLNIDGIDLDSKKEDLNSFQQKLVNLQIENFDLRQKIFTLEGQSIQLYLDLGEGFSESNSLKLPIEQAKLRYEILLDPSKEYRQFRVDISNSPVKVVLKRIFILDVNNDEYKLEIKESNGVLLNDREYIFSNFDPQFYFEPFSKPLRIKSFILEFIQLESNVLVYQTALKIADYLKDLAVLEKDKMIQAILEKDKIIQAIFNSKSYILGFLLLHPFQINSWKRIIRSFKTKLG